MCVCMGAGGGGGRGGGGKPERGSLLCLSNVDCAG